MNRRFFLLHIAVSIVILLLASCPGGQTPLDDLKPPKVEGPDPADQTINVFIDVLLSWSQAGNI